MTKQKLKNILRWFFCIPKDCKITSDDILLITYSFIGSMIGSYLTFRKI